MQNNKTKKLNSAYKKGFKFRFFPDSEQTLSDRTWKCPDCGMVHDNNAALNLFNYDEHNAKKIIKNVLAYHKEKKKLLAKTMNKTAKIKLNNKLIL